MTLLLVKEERAVKGGFHTVMRFRMHAAHGQPADTEVLLYRAFRAEGKNPWRVY